MWFFQKYLLTGKNLHVRLGLSLVECLCGCLEMEKNEVVEIRKLLRLTQADFARLFDTHVMTVSRWERGTANPTPYQAALMEQFRVKALSSEAKAIEELKALLVGAGVIAALIWLLSQAKK
jgi:DNA-binding transcriptional regulator YiaG